MVLSVHCSQGERRVHFLSAAFRCQKRRSALPLASNQRQQERDTRITNQPVTPFHSLPHILVVIG